MITPENLICQKVGENFIKVLEEWGPSGISRF